MALLPGGQESVKIQRWEESVIQAASSGGGGGGDEEDTPEKIAEMARKASNRGTVDIAPEPTDDEDEDARISPLRSPDRPHDAPADHTQHRLGSNIFKHVIFRIGHIIYSCNPVCHLYIYIYIEIDIYIHILPLRQLASDRNECAIDFYFVNLLCCNGTSKLSWWEAVRLTWLQEPWCHKSCVVPSVAFEL